MKPTHLASIAAVCVLCSASAIAQSDTRIVVEEGVTLGPDAADLPEGVRRSFAEQESTTVTYWFRADRMARVDAGGRWVGRLDRGEMYLLHESDQTYTVLSLTDSEGPPLGGGTLVRSGERRQVGPWNAVRYDLTVETDDEPMTVTLWVSEQVPVNLTAYRAYMRAMAARPGFQWMRRLLDLPGYPVRQEVAFGFLHSWQEVESVSQEAAPAGIYEVPPGYRKRD